MCGIVLQLSWLSQLITVSTDIKVSKERASSIFRFKASRANQNRDKSKRELNPVLSPCLRNTYLGMNKTGNLTWRNVRVTLVALENTRSITYSECVSKALLVQHAMRMRRIILSSVDCLALPHFSAFSHKRHDKLQKNLLNTKSVFWFSLQVLSETFLFLRRTETSGVPRGGVCGVQTPPPRNSEGPPKSYQTQPDLWKLLKIAEFRTPTPQDVQKKGSKILKPPRFAIVLH